MNDKQKQALKKIAEAGGNCASSSQVAYNRLTCLAVNGNMIHTFWKLGLLSPNSGCIGSPAFNGRAWAIYGAYSLTEAGWAAAKEVL